MLMKDAKFSGFYKVVKPAPDTAKVMDNMSLDSSAYNNFSWYQRLVHGSSSRLTRYQEFDTMDQDVDIARALDLVAEEMTNVNSKTKLPLDLNVEVDPSVHVPANIVSTLRVALKHWTSIRGFHHRMFSIARHTVKYGDLFFRKIEPNTDKERWEFVHCKNVVAAIVDDTNVDSIIGWQIKQEIRKPKENVGGVVNTGREYETELVPASEIVRFTLNDDMSDQAPFGQSVLSTVYRVQKQKELLEDAIVIYRVQRAPERRVFYIDVGKMPPQRTKQYLEQIKNEIRQKKVPSMTGGTANIDSTYNPQSMSEDFFFASRPNGNNTKVETLPGGQNLGELTDLEYFRQKVLEGLRIPPSYLPNFQSGDMGSTMNDGAVGVSYMQEIQFFKYVIRLQHTLNMTLDTEFKRFMQMLDIRVDPSIYRITLPEPTNFEAYKQAAVDSNLLSQFGNADGVEYLSKRFILSRYLGLTLTEISTNETLLMQERGLDPKQGKALVQIYNSDLMDVDEGGGGGLPTGSPGDLGDNASIDGMATGTDDDEEESDEDDADDTPDEEQQ